MFSLEQRGIGFREGWSSKRFGTAVIAIGINGGKGDSKEQKPRGGDQGIEWNNATACKGNM